MVECECVKSAYNAIISKQPQLVFLDIEMPDGNGFDLLKMFKIPPLKVIFVTAYSDHAIRAFRFSATYYLLKPVKVDELVDAVNKVRSDITQNIGIENINTHLENMHASVAGLNNLVIIDTKGFTIVKISELILCNGKGYVTHFFMTGHRQVSSSKNLKYYEELLEPLGIIRVHHSWLVNLNYVKGYNRQGEIILHEEMKCQLGTSCKNRFMELVSKLR